MFKKQDIRKKKKVRTAAEILKRKKKRRIIWISILSTLIIIRLILPTLVLKYVNNKLANLEEYYGHVEDIDLHLYRGAYVIKNIHIVRKVIENKKTTDTIPFFSSPKVDLSIEWSALWNGAIVGKINVEKPIINFVKEAHKGENVQADKADFNQLIHNLILVTVNRFDIHDGEIHYIDKEVKPNLDIAMKEIQLTAQNLTNAIDSKELLPATLKATGKAYEGNFKLNVKFDGLADTPTFDLNTELKGLNLVLLNDLLREYGNFDVKKGGFDLFAEFAAKNGAFGGYVKPLLKDLDVVQWTKQEGNFRQKLWETVVGISLEALQNQRKEQLATKVPITGHFDNANINKWYAISYILRNAYLHSLQPSIDNSININNLKNSDKTLLERVFGNKDESKKKERKAVRKAKREKRKKG